MNLNKARKFLTDTLDFLQPKTRNHAGWPLLVELEKDISAYPESFIMHDDKRLYGHMSSKGNALIARLVAKKLQATP